MIIDCVSDLHGHYPELEGGDLLIVAGDLTARDLEYELALFDFWINEQPYKKKIVIAGNHDNVLAEKRIKFQFCDYLCDSGTEFCYYNDRFPEEDEGFLPSGKRILKIWGSPWTLKFPGMNPHSMAFTVNTEEELAEKWKLIPDDIDILITHCPPYGILDTIKRKEFCGSIGLRNITLGGQKFKNKKLHIFGHIHEWGGRVIDLPACKFVNASIVNEDYQPVNKPIKVIL